MQKQKIIKEQKERKITKYYFILEIIRAQKDLAVMMTAIIFKEILNLIIN